MPSKDDTKPTKRSDSAGKGPRVSGRISGPSREESDRSTIKHSLALERYGRLGKRQ